MLEKHYKISQLNILFNETLIGAVNTYSGKTFIFRKITML